MKTIILRLLLFILCATVLGFISQVGFNVEEGRVYLVGRCQVSFEGLTPDLITSKDAKSVINANTVGIAQVELASFNGNKPVFKVNRIFSVKTDENGYFMLKNLSNQYTYVLLGIQHQKNLPVPVHFLSLVNAREKQGKMVNLGFHQVCFRHDESSNRRVAEAKIDTSMQNHDFIEYFISRSMLKSFVSKIKTNGFWGKSNAVTIVESGKVSFENLDKAEWISYETTNS